MFTPAAAPTASVKNSSWMVRSGFGSEVDKNFANLAYF
jgi:hypothetical protein